MLGLRTEGPWGKPRSFKSEEVLKGTVQACWRRAWWKRFAAKSIIYNNLTPTKSPSGNIPSSRENQLRPSPRLIQGDQNSRTPEL
jgi:hypothetical protein